MPCTFYHFWYCCLDNHLSKIKIFSHSYYIFLVDFFLPILAHSSYFLPTMFFLSTTTAHSGADMPFVKHSVWISPPIYEKRFLNDASFAFEKLWQNCTSILNSGTHAFPDMVRET